MMIVRLARQQTIDHRYRVLKALLQLVRAAAFCEVAELVGVRPAATVDERDGAHLRADYNLCVVLKSGDDVQTVRALVCSLGRS